MEAKSKHILIKPDKSEVEFKPEKLKKTLLSLSKDLSSLVSIPTIMKKITEGLSQRMTIEEMTKLVSETIAYMNLVHPDHSTLAARILVHTLHKTTFEKIEDYANLLFKFEGKKGLSHSLLCDRTYKAMMDHKDFLNDLVDYSRDFNYDFFGYRTLEKSYLLRVRGEIKERPQQLIIRVAVGIHGDDMESVKETYNLMSEKWFTHATPTLFNAGTRKPQMSSCFLLSMSDDSIDGIYDTLKRCALISKSAGGIGLSVSCIRAKGSYIAGTNGISNGIVPMLRVYDATARYVDQGGGKRKGSFAMYIEPWHADIFDFLHLKKNHGKEELRARDLFYAMWTPDLFMKRVEMDGDWTLMCPKECPCLLYTSPSPRDLSTSRMPSSA